MVKILLLVAAGIFVVIAVFFLNWFWRILAIPTFAVIAYDVWQGTIGKNKAKHKNEA